MMQNIYCWFMLITTFLSLCCVVLPYETETQEGGKLGTQREEKTDIS